MRLATEATAVGIWQWNVLTNQVRWDAQMFRMYGIEPTAGGFVTFSEWCECVVPEDLPHRLEALREIVRVAGKGRGEFCISRRSDGATRHMQSVETARTDVHGQTEWVVGTNLDVTDTKAAQRLLRMRERELQSLADNTPDMLSRLDREYRHVFVNTAVERATGLSAADMVGKTHRQLGMPPQLCGLWESAIQSVFDNGLASVIDFTYAGTAGARHYSTRFIPELDARGAIESVLGVTIDNTNQMQLEQSLRAGDRRKDEFLATLAHELRNPLAPILNAVEILKLSLVGPTAHLPIEIMDRQVHQMVRLIDDLLDVSRITNGKLFLRRERVSLAVILDAALEATAALMRQREHDFTLVPIADTIYLDGDPTRLVQVFTNLLTNAAKYTENGGKITLSTVREGSDVVVSVSDSGVGIPSHMTREIFEMFSQVDRGLEKTTGGLGIGLALVKGLVEMHGGLVQARSDGHGRGSVFLVRLPELRDGVKPVAPLGHDDQPTRKSLRVLVADDNYDAAESMTAMLQLLGHSTLTARDGEDAVSACESFQPDVVLLDIGMPMMNGFEACRQIRLQPWSSAAVIIALTGWGTEDDRRRTRDIGFDHHLTKPVNLATLVAILRRLTPKTRVDS